MSVIMMCHGDGCNKKQYCYRHTAEAKPLLKQARFSESPLSFYDNYQKQTCPEYWPNNEGQLHDKRIEQGKERE